MGCGGTKLEMSKNDIIEWVKSEKAIFQEEHQKEEKKESEKLMHTLQKGMSNPADQLAEGLKAYGEMQKNIEFQIIQLHYLDSFNEIEISLRKNEYNKLNLIKDIFTDFLKIKENKDFASTSTIMERFRQYCRENSKNTEIIINHNPMPNVEEAINNNVLIVN